MLLKNYNI